MFARTVLALLIVSAAPQPTAADVVAENGGIYQDRALAAYVQAVGARLGAAAGRTGWRFAVLDTPDPNAFALPDGRVFVTRGMLALIGDEAELAAVLGHEIGHAVAGDGTVPLDPRDRAVAEFTADHRGMRLHGRRRLRPAGPAGLPADAARQPGARGPAAPGRRRASCRRCRRRTIRRWRTG